MNNHKIPRLAIPILLRNFYYKNTGNSDLNNYRKFNLSFVSKLRKNLVTYPFYSSFRTLNQKEKIFFEKDNYYKK